MNRLLDGYCKVLEALVALFLAVMVVLVFGNVVLRYAFNSGITVSEEVSRWLFVWVTFMGATVALRRAAHLGTDFLVDRLSAAGKRACLLIGHVLMLWVAWLLLVGSWKQAVINASVTAPVTGAPVALVYAAGVLFAASALVFLMLDLVRLFRGQLSEAELVMVRDSEERATIDDVLRPPAAQTKH
jgi:TRAP-type C4-dicarboxylate transport system permease small subunit